MLGMGVGACQTGGMLEMRRLGGRGEAEWRTVLLFWLGVCLSSRAGLAIEGWGHADLLGYAALVGVGVAGLFGQLAMTRAFGVGSALLTAALQYSTIIFAARSEEHTSELQSLMRISYAVFCLKKKIMTQ